MDAMQAPMVLASAMHAFFERYDVLVARPAEAFTAMSTPKKLRLDELLVARGLVESRAQAKALIMSGRVLRGTERLDKPGKEFPADLELTPEVREDHAAYIASWLEVLKRDKRAIFTAASISPFSHLSHMACSRTSSGVGRFVRNVIVVPGRGWGDQTVRQMRVRS